MKFVTLLTLGILFTACGGTPVPDGSAMSDGSTTFTLRCDDGWAKCYTAAGKACGTAGYEEIDRVVDGSLSNAGRVQSRVFVEGGRDNEVYDEGLRNEVTSRVITIRCKSP